MVKEHINKFYYHSYNKLPKCILFYRDGVSDSQFGMVSHEELPQIRNACEEIAEEIEGAKHWKPKITLLVVTKRHHARFFPVPTDQAGVNPGEDNDINLKCGTVADTKVVAPHMWNFYLQSHHSKLGTARGAHYVVICDDVGYTSWEIQHIVSHPIS